MTEVPPGETQIRQTEPPSLDTGALAEVLREWLLPDRAFAYAEVEALVDAYQRRVSEVPA